MKPFPLFFAFVFGVFHLAQSQSTFRDFPQQITYHCVEYDTDGGQLTCRPFRMVEHYIYDAVPRLQALLSIKTDSLLHPLQSRSISYVYNADGMIDSVITRQHFAAITESNWQNIPSQMLHLTTYHYHPDSHHFRRLETAYHLADQSVADQQSYDYHFAHPDSIIVTHSVQHRNGSFQPQTRKIYCTKTQNPYNHYTITSQRLQNDLTWQNTQKKELVVDGFIDMESLQINGRLIDARTSIFPSDGNLTWQEVERFTSFGSDTALWFDSCLHQKRQLTQWVSVSASTFKQLAGGECIKEEKNYHIDGSLKNHLRQVYRLDAHQNMVEGRSESNINGEWHLSELPSNQSYPFEQGTQLSDIRYNHFHDHIRSPKQAIRFMVQYASLSVGHSPLNRTPAVSVYPNPTKGIVSLQTENLHDIVSGVLYDSWGRLRLEHLEKNFSHIDLSSLPNGIYFLRLYTRTGYGTVKIIKQ